MNPSESDDNVDRCHLRVPTVYKFWEPEPPRALMACIGIALPLPLPLPFK
jgi:hypothetical protein